MISGVKPAHREKTTVFKSLGKTNRLPPGHKYNQSTRQMKGEVNGSPGSVGEWLGNHRRVHHLDQSFTCLGGLGEPMNSGVGQSWIRFLL